MRGSAIDNYLSIDIDISTISYSSKCYMGVTLGYLLISSLGSTWPRQPNEHCLLSPPRAKLTLDHGAAVGTILN